MFAFGYVGEVVFLCLLGCDLCCFFVFIPFSFMKSMLQQTRNCECKRIWPPLVCDHHWSQVKMAHVLGLAFCMICDSLYFSKPYSCFIHTFPDIPVNKRPLSIHKVKLVVQPGPGLSDSGRVTEHTHSTLHVS